MTDKTPENAGAKSPTPELKHSTPVESALSPARVREQLQKLITSRTFSQSKRLVRFLSFIVERTLLERGDQLNEYWIGLEVYERHSSFDPQIDTIVRTEARRLRKKLQQYYETEGAHDPILVDVPKGAYVPVFRKRDRAVLDKQVGQLISHCRIVEKLGEGAMGAEITHPVQAPPTRLFSRNRMWVLGGAAASLAILAVSLFWFPGNQSRRNQPVSVSASVPRLAVLPFESRTPGEENQALSYAISDSLITRLARLSGLQVTSWTSVRRLTERKATLPEIAKLLKVDYILEGSFLKAGEGFCVTVQCIRTADDSHVWAEEFSATWKDIFAVQKQVSEGVVRQVNAQLNTRDRRTLSSIPPQDGRAYQAYAKGHYSLLKYYSLFQPTDIRDAEYRLKEAIEIDPDYSDALADLGRIFYLRLYPTRDDRIKM